MMATNPGLAPTSSLWRSACAMLFGVSLLMPACQGPLRPIFPETNPPILWPPPPDQPRIRYIGQLTGEFDLHAPKSAWTVLGEVFTGPRPTIGFSTPTAVAVRNDRVFVSDSQHRALFVLNLTDRTLRAITSVAGQSFLWPIDLALSEDRLALADAQAAAIHLFDLNGTHVSSFGAGDLKRPAAIAWNASAREWWVLDAAAHACVLFDATGKPVRTIGRRGVAPGEYNFPAGLTFHTAHGAVIADAMNFRVQLLDDQAEILRVFGTKGDAAGNFALPRDAAFDSEGHLYVLDSQFENVQVFDREGTLLLAFGHEGRNPGEFYLPSGITIDEQDRIWIADTYNRRIQVFQYLPPPQETIQ